MRHVLWPFPRRPCSKEGAEATWQRHSAVQQPGRPARPAHQRGPRLAQAGDCTLLGEPVTFCQDSLDANRHFWQHQTGIELQLASIFASTYLLYRVRTLTLNNACYQRPSTTGGGEVFTDNGCNQVPGPTLPGRGRGQHQGQRGFKQDRRRAREAAESGMQRLHRSHHCLPSLRCAGSNAFQHPTSIQVVSIATLLHVAHFATCFPANHEAEQLPTFIMVYWVQRAVVIVLVSLSDRCLLEVGSICHSVATSTPSLWCWSRARLAVLCPHLPFLRRLKDGDERANRHYAHRSDVTIGTSVGVIPPVATTGTATSLSSSARQRLSSAWLPCRRRHLLQGAAMGGHHHTLTNQRRR